MDRAEAKPIRRLPYVHVPALNMIVNALYSNTTQQRDPRAHPHQYVA